MIAFKVVQSAFDNFKSKVLDNMAADRRYANEMIRRKREEALAAAKAASQAATKASLSALVDPVLSVSAAVAGVHAARSWSNFHQIESRANAARDNMNNTDAQVRARLESLEATVLELKRGEGTQKVFTQKASDWNKIAERTEALMNNLKERGSKASWLSQQASANYEAAVKPQLAALNDMWVTCFTNQYACQAVVDAQSAMYDSAGSTFTAALSNLPPHPSASEDSYYAATRTAVAVLESLNQWRAPLFNNVNDAGEQISHSIDWTMQAAINVNNGWPQRSQHDYMESEVGNVDLVINADQKVVDKGGACSIGYRF